MTNGTWRRLVFTAVGLLAIDVCGCASVPRAAVRTVRGDDSFCTPPDGLPRLDAPNLPLAQVRFQPRLQARYSRRALAMAHAVGALHELEGMEAVGTGVPGAGAQVRALGDRVLQRLQLGHQQCAAMVAELHCEGERADQSREFMEEREANATRLLTVASVTVGGGSAVASAIVGRFAGGSNEELVLGIVGGVATAALGLSIFAVHEQRLLSHQRNPIADIWTGPRRSEVFPGVVWYYLTQPEFSNTGERAIRENMVQRWARFEHLSHGETPLRTERETLLFGSGGMYGVDDLVVRAALLEQTSSAVALLDQEIDRLAREVFLRLDALAPDEPSTAERESSSVGQ